MVRYEVVFVVLLTKISNRGFYKSVHTYNVLNKLTVIGDQSSEWGLR